MRQVLNAYPRTEVNTGKLYLEYYRVQRIELLYS